MTLTRNPEVLSDAPWARWASSTPGGCKGKRRPLADNRPFLDAALRMTRAGSRCKDLPERFGKAGTAKRRYYDWMTHGAPFDLLAEEADLE